MYWRKKIPIVVIHFPCVCFVLFPSDPYLRKYSVIAMICQYSYTYIQLEAPEVALSNKVGVLEYWPLLSPDLS